VYEGKNLEAGKKSYAVNFLLQDETKTLTDNQIDSIMKNCQVILKTNWEQNYDDTSPIPPPKEGKMGE